MRARTGAFFGDSGRVWRSLIGLLVCHAIVFQGLALGFRGLPPATVAGLPIFALCLNGAHAAPGPPADIPGEAVDGHCLLCTAGWQPLLDAPPLGLARRIDIKIARVQPALGHQRPPAAGERAIAQPRAPPRIT
jgi:hypothetical protein